ncbi:hypothetical protein QBC46DRAFT_390161 [Diplogelasinospora grovesii]|uniref:Erythromycin biosynthesis protein CIII-like C-terminal domain-containing protein n=1 Tax=Diplogelasinospora grovesii TaxID=303347 RepID=A0AAN6N3M7_9PEZI|nr:hypothetical protein QBC46DRAFT_390161 [Diplogelasinospora grovesii]
MFFGVLPLFYGAPLPDGITRPLTMALSIMVPFIRSSGLPPFFLYTNGPAHTSVSLEERKAHIATCSEDWRCRTADLTELMAAKMQQTGATTWVPEGSFMEISPNYLHHRAILQLGVPSFFLPRGDWPGQFKFIGVLPPAQEPPDGWPNLPEWWSDVTSASSEQGKKIVVVAQGTVEVDPHQLIIPTISALQDRNDVLLVAILGRKGARLPPHIQPDVPGNVRVTDFIHYDAILQHAHVWVHNAGYGAVQHGIAHAVPMVVTAEGQDKPENALRVAASGIGVNLGPSTPGPEQVLNAVNQVLDDTNGFQKRAREVREEAQGFRCFELVEKEILALVDPYSGTS